MTYGKQNLWISTQYHQRITVVRTDDKLIYKTSDHSISTQIII